MTGASAPLKEHFVQMAADIRKKFISSKKDLVVEFGSNDGVLLGALVPHCRVLGVDPAKNMARFAALEGVKTITDYFGHTVAQHIRKKEGVAKVIIANNVFAHINDIDDVMRGVTTLLASEGAFIIETHFVGNLITEGGFDQIYHEHVSYFSLYALITLAKKHHIVITDAELVPTHGASLRVTFQHTGKPHPRVTKLLALERRMGLHKKSTFKKFGGQVVSNKKKLVTLLATFKKEGKKIVGYGAPAKGNTLLNYFGITPTLIDYITDTTPLKQGLYTPGSHIPIVSPQQLIEEPPDIIVLLSWNYAESILKKELALRASGVRFVIPVPKVKII